MSTGTAVCPSGYVRQRSQDGLPVGGLAVVVLTVACVCNPTSGTSLHERLTIKPPSPLLFPQSIAFVQRADDPTKSSPSLTVVDCPHPRSWYMWGGIESPLCGGCGPEVNVGRELVGSFHYLSQTRS